MPMFSIFPTLAEFLVFLRVCAAMHGRTDLRLCNLAQTDVLGHLPLPCAPTPVSTEECLCAIDEVACASDPALLQEMLHALHSVDTSYLCA